MFVFPMMQRQTNWKTINKAHAAPPMGTEVKSNFCLDQPIYDSGREFVGQSFRPHPRY